MLLQRLSYYIFFFAVCACSTSVFVQKQFGSAQGTVHDAEGQPIPGASIVASSELLGSTTVYTDRTGRYRIEALVPGTYDLEARFHGFQSVLKSGARILIGSTITVDFVLEPEKVTESVTVLSETPLIDSTTTAVSHTVPVEIIQGLPDRAGFASLLALTPGVGDDGVAYGASARTSNRVWIDGVDVSSAANGGLFLSGIPYNWIEEVQVVGNGAPAEYGNYLGVIGNFVTRSGGNQFHGLVETFFQNENLVSTNTPDPRLETPFKSWNLSSQIGGPITRDKLWFFSGVQYSNSQTTPFRYDGIQADESSMFITKLTYKANQNNTIQGFARFGHRRFDGVDAGPGVLPETTRLQIDDESTFNATWISQLNAATTLEGRFGAHWAKRDFLPRNGDVSAHHDVDRDVWYENASSTNKDHRSRLQGNFELTHYAGNYLGSHEFKFGTQFQASNVRNEEFINGGFTYYSYTDDYGDPVIFRVSQLQDPTHFDGDTNQVSVFAHDTWNLNPAFSLSLGLRWDHNRGSTGRGIVLSTDPVAPRIGMIWKLRENKPIVIKAHYGDYYDALLTRQFVLLSDQQYGFQSETFDTSTNQWVQDYLEQSVFSSAPDNKHPFVRQFIIGTDQELPGKIAAGAHYIYRSWHNFLEDIELNANFEPVLFPNPVTGEIITVYSRPENNLRYRLLTNPGGLHRRYDGLELYLDRQFLNHMALSASFVYSKTRGNVPNTREEDTDSFSEFLNDPNQFINFTGHLVNDPTFEWKFSGVYNLPYGLNLGFFFRHQGGDTWEPLVELGDAVNQPDAKIFGLPHGSFRLPSQNTLDMRVEKQFPMLSGQFRITADIFNVFNAGTPTEVEATWGNQNYGEPSSFVGPRQIRLGLRYTF